MNGPSGTEKTGESAAAADTAAAASDRDGARAFQERRRAYWQAQAERGHHPWWLGGAYHRRLADIYAHLVPPGSRVLELGCGSGDLLAALQPARGVGVDFAPAMIAAAQARHPGLEFICADAHEGGPAGPFDAIILSDLLNDAWDAELILRRLHASCHPGTRVILNSYSRLWQWPLGLAKKMGLARPSLAQNWLAPEDMRNLLHLAGFETLRSWGEYLLPLPVPLVAPLANRFLAKVAPFRWFDFTTMHVARPIAAPRWAAPPLVTVVVPARNEAGNIAAIMRRTPEMGAGTELIFVEGGSGDDTYGTIARALAAEPGRRAKLLRQAGKGKGDAVRTGFSAATGGILMILDADLTVPPEDLPRFYQALVENRGEFINGVRLVYPMEAHAMRFFNLIANKSFSMAFSWLLGQPLKDTLCGTKVLSREDYARIAANRAYFGEFDPFGDFDLIFGAAKLNLRLIDVPIRYRERTYGTTNIQRWRHGMILLRMLIYGAKRLKFR